MDGAHCACLAGRSKAENGVDQAEGSIWPGRAGFLDDQVSREWDHCRSNIIDVSAGAAK